MVLIQDQIRVQADKLSAVLTLFRERYQSDAEQRGMTLLESRVSPPLRLADGEATLWQRWQVADVGAWWAMRAQAGTPEVAAFWEEVDTLCSFRERIYLTESDSSLPAGKDISRFDVQPGAYRETSQLTLKEGASDSDKAALVEALNQAQSLEGLKVFSLSENLAPEYAAGHYTFDLLFASEAQGKAAQSSAIWKDHVAPALAQYCSTCHAVTLDTLGAGLRTDKLTNATKRTAFFRLLPGVSPDTAQRFEQDLLEMPAQIPEILNWRLSRAVPLSWNTNEHAWTYVWEQEFESLDDLLGPYMINPHHWSHIDRWFDPESGVQAIDVNLSHAFSPLQTSLMAIESNM